MATRSRTYKDHLKYCEKIEAEIRAFGLSYPLLATLARLTAKVQHALAKQQQGWFMESEFAGIGTNLLVDKGLVEREFQKYDWHPSGVKGAYVYTTSAKGADTLKDCEERISMAGLKLYY